MPIALLMDLIVVALATQELALHTLIDSRLPRDFSSRIFGIASISKPPHLGQDGRGSRVKVTSHAEQCSSIRSSSRREPERWSSVLQVVHTISWAMSRR